MKIGYWLLFTLRIYTTWSRLYRFLFQRKYRSVPLDRDLDPKTAQSMMDSLTWTKDGSKELWDAIASPHWVQTCLQHIADGGPQPAGALDCDDFSAWASNVLAPTYRPMILNVFWHHEKDGFSGHNLCLYTYPYKRECPKTIGNWGHFSATHGHLINVPGIDALLSKVLDVKGPYTELVGWSLLSKDLGLLRVSTADLTTRLPLR